MELNKKATADPFEAVDVTQAFAGPIYQRSDGRNGYWCSSRGSLQPSSEPTSPHSGQPACLLWLPRVNLLEYRLLSHQDVLTPTQPIDQPSRRPTGHRPVIMLQGSHQPPSLPPSRVLFLLMCVLLVFPNCMLSMARRPFIRWSYRRQIARPMFLCSSTIRARPSPSLHRTFIQRCHQCEPSVHSDTVECLVSRL